MVVFYWILNTFPYSKDYIQGIKLSMNSAPKDSIPKMSGVKKPQTGQSARMNSKIHATPMNVIDGMIRGQ